MSVVLGILAVAVVVTGMFAAIAVAFVTLNYFGSDIEDFLDSFDRQKRKRAKR